MLLNPIQHEIHMTLNLSTCSEFCQKKQDFQLKEIKKKTHHRSSWPHNKLALTSKNSGLLAACCSFFPCWKWSIDAKAYEEKNPNYFWQPFSFLSFFSFHFSVQRHLNVEFEYHGSPSILLEGLHYRTCNSLRPMP